MTCLAIILWALLLNFSPTTTLEDSPHGGNPAQCYTILEWVQSFDIINALSSRAQQRLLSNAFDLARADLDTAIALDVDNPALYVLRGQVYLALYEWDLSLEDYNTALQIDSTYADAYFYRGVLQYSILQTGYSTHEDALNDFEQYLQLAPHGGHASQAEQYALTIRDALEALKRSP